MKHVASDDLKNTVGLVSFKRVGVDVLNKAHSKNKAKLEVFGIMR